LQRDQRGLLQTFAVGCRRGGCSCHPGIRLLGERRSDHGPDAASRFDDGVSVLWRCGIPAESGLPEILYLLCADQYRLSGRLWPVSSDRELVFNFPAGRGGCADLRGNHRKRFQKVLEEKRILWYRCCERIFSDAVLSDHQYLPEYGPAGAEAYGGK